VTEPVYSPQLRTGVLLGGSGTAGAYQAGALRAIIEAGVKIDVIAAHGAGVLTALATAVDGGSRVWDSAGPWTDPRLRWAYRWRPALRAAFLAFLGSLLLLLSPLIVLVLAGATYLLATLAALVSLSDTAASLVGIYRQTIEMLFDPPILPTLLPRAMVLAMLLIAAILAVPAWYAIRRERSRRRVTGMFWWRLLSSPLDATEPGATCLETLWHLVRGASSDTRPQAAEVGRRYIDVLSDNFGQPGFHEVLVAVHDIDARRDLVAAVLAAPARAVFEDRHADRTARTTDLVDLTGPQRATLTSFLAGSLRLPLATEPAIIEFPTDSPWHGERHRVCDRPELAMRLVDELARLGLEQVIVISPAPPPAQPHTLRSRPIDMRGRLGELMRSMETAALADTVAAARSRFAQVFVVHPDHNPIGPFDFGGAYDESSDRHRTMSELIAQGHADAYRILVEPGAAAAE
jgi:hypothetical protein